MQIVIFEFIAGGGMLQGEAPTGSLLREGRAMLQAVVADFARLEGCDVVTTWDDRLDGAPECGEVRRVRSAEVEHEMFLALAADADGVLLIAPEFDGLLLDRVRQVEEVGGRLLGPDSRFVAAASDKHETGRRLKQAGVPTPHAVALCPGEPLPRDFPYPAVLKPYDGAGSLDVSWIEGPRGVAPMWRGSPGPDPATWNGAPHGWRLEQFHPGMAASIALLCGPAACVALPACRQILSDDGRFRYLGGETPLAPELHRRAASLAFRALAALPPAVGYVGFDLVLGAATDGSQDVVVEVNPRLTTSYNGLREIVAVNLAELMLQTARSTLGQPLSTCPRLLSPRTSQTRKANVSREKSA
jgi:tyramine---L-glutamate ligase